MRSDYVIYLFAVTCFALAGCLLAVYTQAYLEATTATVAMFVLAILGSVFAGLGYWVRPKKEMPAPPAPPSVFAPAKPPEPTKPKKKMVRKRRKKKT